MAKNIKRVRDYSNYSRKTSSKTKKRSFTDYQSNHGGKIGKIMRDFDMKFTEALAFYWQDKRLMKLMKKEETT